MYGLANGLVSALRGTPSTVGDVLDNGTVAASGISAFIAVRSDKTVQDDADQTPRVIQQVIGASGFNVDISDTEPLREDTHGITYAVQAVTQPQSAGPGSDLLIAAAAGHLDRVDRPTGRSVTPP